MKIGLTRRAVPQGRRSGAGHDAQSGDGYSIAQVWTRKFSLVRTLEIVGGFLVAAAIERGALGNTQLFPDDY